MTVIQEFEILKDVVTQVRSLRHSLGVKGGEEVPIVLRAEVPVLEVVAANYDIIAHLAKTEMAFLFTTDGRYYDSVFMPTRRENKQ